MTSSMYRSQLERKREQRVGAEKRSGELRAKEAEKRSLATRARAAASASRTESTIKQKLREAERYEGEANTAAKESASWQTKAAGYLKEEAKIQKDLHNAEESERKRTEQKRDSEERKRAQDEVAARRKQDEAQKRSKRDADAAARENARLHHELSLLVNDHSTELAQLRQPRVEKLRLLMLTASGEGDLRVGREQKRIQDAVRFASGRESVVIDVCPAATGEDLLNGLTQTRPHIVHFSGHGNDTLVVFEEDTDHANHGAVVSGHALAAALSAVDEPPLLVVLNSCSSAPQAQQIANGIAKVAIGHSDSIGDADAIAYSARFYAALADGQSILASHNTAKAALMFAGTPDFDLPTLYSAPGIEAAEVVLVLPPSTAVRAD